MLHIQTRGRNVKNGVAVSRGWILHCLAALSLLILGTFLLVRGALPVLIHWPYNYTEPVRAQIVDSRFEEVPGWQGIFRSRPVFSYRYVHQGELFQSSTYRPVGDRSEAVRRYVPGLAIDAFVDPAHPARSMIQPGLTGHDLATPAIGLIALFLAFLRVRRLLH